MNRLMHEKSPYLLQHADNPVDWFPWGEEALEKAKKEDKPIFLSIGYSTCHWCHVMAHESFEDDAVARALNEGFVPIKVDREERPDVDQVYMNACVATTGAGGWPLTAFLAPDQKPFLLATYLPKRARYGQPGLMEVLETVSRMWRTQRASLLTRADRITAHIAETAPADEAEIAPETLDRAAEALLSDYVPSAARFGAAPLFPMPMRLLFLARQGEAGQSAARAVLERMARGGIFDHVGGGFSRYSTDDKWLIPHFEKMLYDNALLAYACAEVASIAGDAFLARAAERTINYVLRELRDPSGGFYCAQDADSEGREGLFYAFEYSEILEVVGAQGAIFAKRFGMTQEGNFEGRAVPNLLGDSAFRTAWAENADALTGLRTYRANRFSLGRDDKILTSWNGLMIAALSRAGMLLNRGDWITSATRAIDFVNGNMRAPDGGLFARDRAEIPGTLEDYAFFAWGLLEHYHATLAQEDLLEAARVANEAHTRFFDEKNGGYFMTAAQTLVARPKEVFDGPIPSGNGAMALVLTELTTYSLDDVWRQRRDRQFSFLSGGLTKQPAAHALALVALRSLFFEDRKVVAACANEDAAKTARAVLLNDLGNNHPIVLTPQNQARLIEFADHPLPEAGVKWYICENGACREAEDAVFQSS